MISGEDIAEAVRVLRAGGLIGMPTETVYGLAADAANADAVARLFAAKGRPRFNPLIAHVLDAAAAAREATLTSPAQALIACFWPGPLTIVAPASPHTRVCDLARAGLQTIALRAPDHPTARALLAAFNGPLVAPSANRSGRLSPTNADAVRAELGDRVDRVLDGGQCRIGLESTVIAALDDGPATLLRPGGIARAAIEAVVGPLAVAGAHDAGPASPGMLSSHYAPRARLRLDADAPLPGEAYLGFGSFAAPGAPTLSAAGDLVEAAANLFSALRALDDAGAAVIAVAPIPQEGLGEAIRDRLERAAFGR